MLGAQCITHTPVTDTLQHSDGSWDVLTPSSTIKADIIVNCGGLWARKVGHIQEAQPMEHHCLMSEKIDQMAAHPTRLFCGIYYKTNIYFRQERQGMLLGPMSRNQPRERLRVPLGTLVMNCCHLILTESLTGWNWVLNASRHWPPPALKMQSTARSLLDLMATR